jgi:hypothetical protein
VQAGQEIMGFIRIAFGESVEVETFFGYLSR